MRALLLACLAVATPAFAAQPDLSGFWMLAREIVDPDPELAKKVAPGAAVMRDTKAQARHSPVPPTMTIHGTSFRYPAPSTFKAHTLPRRSRRRSSTTPTSISTRG